MSTCVYKLGGRVFGSELDLDNFLYNYFDVFGSRDISDIVFSQTTLETNLLHQKLDEKQVEPALVQEIKRRMRREEFVSPEERAIARNHYGANYVLSTVLINNKRITPEFRINDLKANLFNQWTGQASSSEPGISKHTAHILKAANYTEGGRFLEAGDVILEPTYTGTSTDIAVTHPKCNAIFENYIWPYWTGLGKVGTAMHRVAEMFWLGEQDKIMNDPIVMTGEDSFTGNLMGRAPVLSNDVIHEFIAFLTTLKAKLQEIHGKNCVFRPEYVVSAKSAVPINGNGKARILGIIDLLVEDEQGIPHIYDYKTSDKDIDQWGEVKKRGYNAQLALYRRILQSYGVNAKQSTMGIIPINLAQYSINAEGQPRVDWIEFPPSPTSGPYIDYIHLREELSALGELTSKVNKLVYADDELQVLPTDFVKDMQKYLKDFFPGYTFQSEYDETVKADIESRMTINLNTGKYMFPPIPGKMERLECEKEEISSHMEEYYKEYVQANASAVQQQLYYTKQAIKEGDPAKLPRPSSRNRGEKGEWFIAMFTRYCNGQWEPVENKGFESLNILVLRNKISGQVNFFVFDNNNIADEVKMKEGSTILGKFTDDITPQYSGITPLKATLGNIDLMKAMIAINLAYSSVMRPGDKMGEIMTMNIWKQQGATTSTKQLLDNFGALCDFSKTDMPNNYANGKVNIASATQKVASTVLELGSLEKIGALSHIYAKYEKSLLSLNIEMDELQRLRNELESAYPDLAKGEVDINTPQGSMYSTIMTAIAEMHGAFYTQETRDGDRVMLKVNNPEMMESSNLRRLHALTNNAFYKLRDRMNAEAEDWRRHYDKLVKSKGYSRAEKWITDNDNKLYENMYIYNQEQGIYKFKNPWDNSNDLTSEEREFLKWYLDKQDRLRHENTGEDSEEQRRIRRMDSNSIYYDVPLMESRGQDKVMSGRTKGLVSWFKRSIQWWRHPIQNSRETALRLEAKVLTNDQAKEASKTAQAFRILDVFEESENYVTRTQLIKDHDQSYFTASLEKIFYAYSFAKVRKNVLDTYMPVLKAMYIMFKTNSTLSNMSLERLQDYLYDYIDAKILNRSLVPDEYKYVARAMSKLRNIASEVTLGLSPKAGLFQVLEGFWKNTSRSLIRPVGLHQFGFKEYKEALIWLLGDAKNHLKVCSMGQLLNEQYAINDQDINVLQDRLRQGQDALTFQGKLMWLVSAPDFMNRMAIFVAQMKKDGCFDAHVMGKDGFSIEYDCSKDSRFNKLKFNRNKREDTDIHTPEYMKQLALYKKMIDELNLEGYKVIDPETGYERSLNYNDKLPQAYTNKEARSIKSLADQLYGYYNHEDQYLLKSYLLGALFTQFKTYWSSLKNRWWLKGGIYSQGHWEQAKNSSGELMYKKVINEGEEGERIIIVPASEADPNTMEPFMTWKGSYQEGFLNSILSLFSSMWNADKNDMTMSQAAKNWWKGQGMDDSVAYTRRANIKLVLHDLTIYALISYIFGSILLGLFKEQKKADRQRNLTAGEKLLRSTEKILLYSMIQSGQDFGISDIVSPVTDWTPPSFAVAKEAWKDMGEVITGDQNFFNALVDNIGFLRQTSSLWVY